MKISKIFFAGGLVLILAGFLNFKPVLARENVNYWYIKDFQSEILVNKDSSLTITEDIIADCGQAVGKHGIFRTLPTQVYKTQSEIIKTPITLISITDFSGRTHPYETINDYQDHTVTWKIGDAAKTVQGENYYRIKYQVQNAIRFDNAQFDEFYWNLNGNFWDLETDSFNAKIIFPAEVNLTDSQINLYSGQFGTKDAGLASYKIISPQTIGVQSLKTLKVQEGITLSATLPKNIFTPYTPGFWEKYGQYFSFLLSIFIFLAAFSAWSKYGRDPKIGGPVVPEFGIPENLTPMEMGMVMSNGNLLSKDISAAIVNLAVAQMIKIEKIGKKDYQLTLLKDDSNLNDAEKALIWGLFGGQKQVKTADLKNKFYKEIPAIQTIIQKKLKNQKLLAASSAGQIAFQIIFMVLAIIFFSMLWVFIPWSLLGVNLIISIIILIVFTFLLSRRTVQNAQLVKKLDGFKLYLVTAEKYRQQFNEKENIFEKYLPYAMVFGVVGAWTKSFAQIYREIHHRDYFATYSPAWYFAAGVQTFDADIFASNLEGLSGQMSQTLASSPSSSGAGSGGFSGGGGGGGGGGGW